MATLEQRLSALEARMRKPDPENTMSAETQAEMTAIIRAILEGEPLDEFDPELVALCEDVRNRY